MSKIITQEKFKPLYVTRISQDRPLTWEELDALNLFGWFSAYGFYNYYRIPSEEFKDDGSYIIKIKPDVVSCVVFDRPVNVINLKNNGVGYGFIINSEDYVSDLDKASVIGLAFFNYNSEDKEVSFEIKTSKYKNDKG